MSKDKILTDKDIREANLRFLPLSIAAFNYQTQNGPAVVYALANALRKLYPDDKDYIEALDNHYKYFNSQPYMASIIIGAALGMEEELGIKGKDAIQNFKAGIMGPTAGIGDSIFWIILPAIFVPIAAASANEGSFVGWFILLAYMIGLAIVRYRFFGWGYKLGIGIIDRFKDKVGVFTEAASILGLTVIGALIPSIVKISCPAEWTLSTGSVINIQNMLDSLMPNLLAIVITAICAVLLGKKKVSMTTLVLAVLIIAIIASSLGILA